MEVPGRYERMRVLGRGSFGAVALVKDKRDSKLYAMKTLSCADRPGEKQTAMEEVRAPVVRRGRERCCDSSGLRGFETKARHWLLDANAISPDAMEEVEDSIGLRAETSERDSSGPKGGKRGTHWVVDAETAPLPTRSTR